MDRSKAGRPTYYARAENWECDYDIHWNIRFYGRSFQCVSETVTLLAGTPIRVLPRSTAV